ncbi:MAG TPA: E2/UBC family protein [Gemmataceae bacterium]|nr:E2/UBC family protein [Gemmataceae bacterium]
MTPLQDQFESLKREFPSATLQSLPSGAVVIAIPDFALPQGWSHPTTTVRFVAPVGYPFAKPDCFWTSPDLRLATGGVPQAANHTTPIPEFNGLPLLWFSWHTGQWNANRDSFLTYAHVIERRFKQLQ